MDNDGTGPETESFLLSKIETVTSASQDYCGGVNEITHIKCSGQAWHTVNAPHRRVLTLIPQAFPEQHCWARPMQGARKQRNYTVNGQAVAPSQVGK